MEINPDKVLDAIAALKAAADVLLKFPSVNGADDVVLGEMAGHCLKCAAALHASVQIAGLTHRTFHTTGELQ